MHGNLPPSDQCQIVMVAGALVVVGLVALGSVGTLPERLALPTSFGFQASVPQVTEYRAPEGYSCVVAADRVNLRSGPSPSYDSIGKLDRGDVLLCLEENGGWRRVRSARGSIGFIRNDLLKSKRR